MDCSSTFPLVCRLLIVRKRLADYNRECCHLDYNISFLNADITERVYVEMAPEYKELDENGVLLVMRLLKSLYGIHQSPTNWWNTIDGTPGGNWLRKSHV